MAKSMRSKIKRKHRAVKRERWNDKVHKKRLLEAVKRGEENLIKQQSTKVVEMKDVEESSDEEVMQIDTSGKEKKPNMDENGQYPVWMNQRKIKRLRKNRNRVERKMKKKQLKGKKKK
ncbi:DgyrCDS12871 [Dimorphilus gyrociliatus]|uniref:DgyrCDS12871 n=1 Tax=Dimorphilus gyrociliatus TaxID=2664684 RepID=A0A7I8W8Z7_9ANNE|nr:DgyrCDS12871 [Dimorphilus gyrociliatus]